MKQNIHDYIYDNLSREEELEIQLMMSGSKDDSALKEALDEEFALMEAENDIDTAKAFSEVKARIGLKSKRRALRNTLRGFQTAAAVAFVPLVVALVLNLASDKQVNWHEINVPAGQTDSLTLADGSLLVLNGGTRITYPEKFTGENRTVFLEGECLADITSDSRHPFIIKSGDSEVMVHGTKFDYNAYKQAENIELLLIEGTVDFNTDDHLSVKLSPGDALHFNKRTRLLSVDKFSPRHYESFAKDRSIHFFNLNMRDIAHYLEKTFGTPIVIRDESIAKMTFYGYFSNGESAREILDCINADERMDIEDQDGTIYLSRK